VIAAVKKRRSDKYRIASHP